MVITRADWRINGDLLAWLATSYPGLPADQFEAGYNLLRDPDISEHDAAQVQVLLRGCCAAASAATLAPSGQDKEV